MYIYIYEIYESKKRKRYVEQIQEKKVEISKVNNKIKCSSLHNNFLSLQASTHDYGNHNSDQRIPVGLTVYHPQIMTDTDFKPLNEGLLWPYRLRQA